MRCHSRMPRGCSRKSTTTPTLTPALMSAASSPTSCTAAPGTSRPDASSRRIVKTLCRMMVAAAPAPRATPHHKWMEMSISFDASDCPKNMAGAVQLPLVISPTIANVMLYHVLIDGGAALNLISLAAFQKLQIPTSRLNPSRPFSGVGPGSIILCCSISFPVTFGTPENYRTKIIDFDIVKVNLPFNTIIGRPALYQFMVIAHYGYLVLTMPSPNSILKIRGDRTTGAFTLEKLQALAAAQDAATGYGEPDQPPSSSRQRVSSSAPYVQPSDGEDNPVKVIHISADAAQTTGIIGNLGDK
jgi:hypothetical protein